MPGHELGKQMLILESIQCSVKPIKRNLWYVRNVSVFYNATKHLHCQMLLLFMPKGITTYFFVVFIWFTFGLHLVGMCMYNQWLEKFWTVKCSQITKFTANNHAFEPQINSC